MRADGLRRTSGASDSLKEIPIGLGPSHLEKCIYLVVHETCNVFQRPVVEQPLRDRSVVIVVDLPQVHLT